MNAIIQKELAGWIDRAAVKAEIVDAEPASSRQCWYLAKLWIEAGEAPDDWVPGNPNHPAPGGLSKRIASRMIDRLKGER